VSPPVGADAAHQRVAECGVDSTYFSCATTPPDHQLL